MFLLDSVLLMAAQWFCDRMQRLTGATKFLFQKWAAILATACFWYVAAAAPGSYMILVMTALYSCSSVFFCRDAEEQEIRFLKRREVTGNPL
jgi:hypothetical protein